MQKMLLRRIVRDLKANLFRYLTLFLLIVLSMFIVISTVASAESVITTVNQKAVKNHLEDGQFGLFLPLDQSTISELEAMGITLEACFSLDLTMKDDSILRVMKNRTKINLLELEQGRQAANDKEIVLERLYANAHDLSPGDTLSVAGTNYTITGIATSPDYDYCLQTMSAVSADGKAFGTAFVTPEAYAKLSSSKEMLRGEEYRYSYRLGRGAKDARLQDYLAEMHSLADFVQGKDNPRIKGANNDVQVNINIGIMAGIVVLILITYVISVFVIHSIDRESTVIGALYALGVKRRQLMLHYTMLPVVLCLFGGILGTALGYSDFGISLMADRSRTYFSIPAVEIAYSPYLLAYGLLLPPLIAFAVNQLVIRKRLNRSALALLRKEQSIKKVNQVKLSGFGFMRAFQIRQFLREKRSCLAVLAGMFVSLLILILGLNCYALCHNVKIQNIQDTKYTYMYQYKYPDKTIPAVGHSAYVEGLKKEVFGYNMEVSFIGIDETNPYFPVIKSQRKNEISISSSVAKKYGLSAGDKVLFSHEINEREFGFTVKEVVPYSVGLSCFMNLDSMRALFGQEDDYYNVVYTDRELDIDAGRLYSVTTKEDIKKSAEIFMDIMAPLVTMLVTVSILLFLIVMYQMMKVMVNRSAESIALMKIFGYRSQEIRKLYLDGNFLLVAVGALAMIPIAKLLMDAVYPTFIANVACGIDMTWPPVLYGIVYVSILLCYLMIRTVLMRRLKNLAPVDVLKNRE